MWTEGRLRVDMRYRDTRKHCPKARQHPDELNWRTAWMLGGLRKVPGLSIGAIWRYDVDLQNLRNSTEHPSVVG